MSPEKEFQRKKVESQTLGEQLQSLRKKSDVPLADLSRQTKIHIRHLRSLEEGAYGQLPSEVYVKGFVRAYEAYFGVQEDALIRILEREYAIFRNINVNKDNSGEQALERVQKGPRIIITRRMVISAFAIGLFIAVTYYLYSGIEQFSRAPWLTLTEPAANAITQESQIIISGQTHPAARVTINEKETTVDTNGMFREEVQLRNGENRIVIKSINQFDLATESVLVVTSEVSVEEPSIQPGVGGGELSVTLRTQDVGTWLSVTVDDVNVFNDTLEQASERIFYAQNQIVVTAGSANAVSVEVNGQERGLLGPDNEVIRDVLFEATALKADSESGENEPVVDDSRVEANTENPA